jgi:hypothetical protein
MGRKIASAMLVALVPLVVVGTLGFAWASSGPNGQEIHRLRLTEPYSQFTETDTDLGDPGLSQGDLATFHGEVYDSTGTTHVGYETSQCVVGSVIAGVYTLNCSSDFVLPAGQLNTEGTLEGAAADGLHFLGVRGSPVRTEHFGISGGSFEYQDVAGQLDWGGAADGFVLSFVIIAH